MATTQRTNKGLTKECILLIVIAGMERFAFKGVASNLVTYLTDVADMSNLTAAKVVNTWCGFTSIIPVLLAPLADSVWDHYSTILASSFFYILGLSTLTSTTFGWIHGSKRASTTFMYLSLCLISLGQGGYNPSLQAFGGEQLRDSSQEEEDLTSNSSTNTMCSSNKNTIFFSWWYFGICSGCLLGVFVMSYIQEAIGWSLGFGVPTLVMVASIMLFCCVSKMFIQGNNVELDHKIDASNIELQQTQRSSKKLTSIKEFATGKNRGDNICFFDNVKVTLKVLPIWSMLLMFAVIFQQPVTFFTKQGMTMRRNIGTKFKIPPATLQGFITISIIILMPFYDKLLVPFTKIMTRNKQGITVMQRIGIGMVFSIIAMVIAALVEEKRLRTPYISIFWLLPQYILLGISDIFTVVGMQEFFYGEVPSKMKAMGIALCTSVFGVGSFLSALLISLIEKFTTRGGNESWFCNDMMKARLDKYYWLLAISSTFSLLVYVVLCKFYRSKNDLTNESSV